MEIEAIPAEILVIILSYCGRPYFIWKLRLVSTKWRNIIISYIKPWNDFFPAGLLPPADFKNKINFGQDNMSKYNIAIESCRKCLTDIAIASVRAGIINKWTAIVVLFSCRNIIKMRGYIDPINTRNAFIFDVKERVKAAEIIFDINNNNTTNVTNVENIAFDLIINLIRICSPSYPFYYSNSAEYVTSADRDIVSTCNKLIFKILKSAAITSCNRIIDFLLASYYFGNDEATNLFLEMTKNKESEGLRSAAKRMREYLLDSIFRLEKENILINGSLDEINNLDETCMKAIKNNNHVLFKYIRTNGYSYTGNKIFLTFSHKFKIIFGAMYESYTGRSLLMKRKFDANFYYKVFLQLLKQNSANEIILLNGMDFDTKFQHVLFLIFCYPANIGIKKYIVEMILKHIKKLKEKEAILINRSSIFNVLELLCRHKKYLMESEFAAEHHLLYKNITDFINNNLQSFHLGVDNIVTDIIVNLYSCGENVMAKNLFNIVNDTMPEDNENWFNINIKNKIFQKCFIPDKNGNINRFLMDVLGTFDRKLIIPNNIYIATVEMYIECWSADFHNICEKMIEPMMNTCEKGGIKKMIIITFAGKILSIYGSWYLARRILDKYWYILNDDDISKLPQFLVGRAKKNMINDLEIHILQWINDKKSDDKIHILKKQKTE